MTITSKAVAKVAAVATGLAMATSMLSLAPIAHAACDVGSASLTIGSTGAAVTCLQQTLIAAGYSIPAGATGYFGTQTQSAVAKWQVAANVSPAAGYFGPISHVAWASWSGSVGGVSMVPGCTSTSGFSPTTGQSCAGAAMTWPAGCTSSAGFSTTTGVACSSSMSLPAGCTSTAGFSSTTGVACSSGGGSTSSGPLTGAGRLTNVSSLGNVTSDIKEGDPITSVVGESADATGGDVAIQRVDATFTVGTSGAASVNLNKYVSDVSLWLNGTKLADMDPALADKTTGTRAWTVRFSGLNGVIKSGTTGQLYVKVTPVSSIGSAETGNTITAELAANSIRAVGADGISDTYGSDVVQNFTVSTSNIGTLTVSTASDNPNASQVAVSSSTTTGVKLLAFNLKAKNQDSVVSSIAASLGTNNSLSNVVATVYLMKDSTVISSKTITGGTYNTVTFTNVNQTITKDSTQEYSIVADLKGDTSYPDGTTLIASTTVSGWDVSDATGATVTPSASASGNTMTLTAAGLTVALGSPTATAQTCQQTSCGDTGNYSIPFTVTAGDSDIYIKGTTDATGVTFATTTSSNSNVTNQGSANLSVNPQVGGSTTGDSGVGVTPAYYRVPANTARTFTLNVSYTATNTGFTGLQLLSIHYGLTPTSMTSVYNSNLTSFKTNDINLVKH